VSHINNIQPNKLITLIKRGIRSNLYLIFVGLLLAILYKTWKFDIRSHSIFVHLFRTYEIPPLLINLFFLSYVWICLNRRNRTCPDSSKRPNKVLEIKPTKSVTLLTPFTLSLLAATIACSVAYAMPNLTTMLSMDEFAAYFQSVLISNGVNSASPPDDLRMSWQAVLPFTFATDSQLKIFRSPYLPGAALIYSIFSGIASVPFLHAICILVTGVTIHQILRLIGFSYKISLLSVALVVLSPQVICLSWTHYAMTFHMFFNSLWLLAYLQRGNARLMTIPIGAFALVLHQYIPHLVFSTPFILYDMYRKRYFVSVGLVVTYTFILVICSVFWFSFGHSGSQGWFVFGNGESTNISSIIALPTIEDLTDKLAHLILFFNWMPVGGAILVLTGLFISVTAFRTNSYAMVALLSISTAIGVHLLCVFDQGHGWGYRYLHASLPAVAILAASGGEAMSKVFSYTAGRRLLLLSAFLTLLLFCYRTSEIDAETRALRKFEQVVKTIPEDILIVDSNCCWYTRDAVRNEPDFSNKPLVLHSSSITKEQVDNLCSQKKCRWLLKDQLLELGFSPVRSTSLIE